MKRRGFAAGLGSLALAWPLALRAQAPGRERRVGVLMGFRESDPAVRAYNLKTAKALGLTIPQSILLRADRVIE